MSKINVQEVLRQKGKEAQYAIVKYNINNSENPLTYYLNYKDIIIRYVQSTPLPPAGKPGVVIISAERCA